MQLQDFFDYKNQLMKDILTNEEIVRLINPDIDFEDSKDLAYTQVFPYEYIPETVQNGSTYICFDVDVSSVSNDTYLIAYFYIWVFCHQSRLRLPEGGVRYDKLCSKICEAINGSRVYGLGRLKLYSAKHFSPMTDYQGKLMTFQMTEFNTPSDSKHPVPMNRKG